MAMVVLSGTRPHIGRVMDKPLQWGVRSYQEGSDSVDLRIADFLWS
jgi:hypothetical protein